MFLHDKYKNIFEDFEKDFELENSCHMIKLPTRKINEILPGKYILAYNCLINLEKQLDKNKGRFADYDKIIQDYIKKRILEQIDHFERNTILGPEHCLPHRGVIKEDHETTKLRIVFDTSTKIRN